MGFKLDIWDFITFATIFVLATSISGAGCGSRPSKWKVSTRENTGAGDVTVRTSKVW